MITLPLNVSQEIPETALSFTHLEITLVRAVTSDLSHWSNPQTTITVDLHVSSDGIMYDLGGSFSAAGGIHTDKTGVEVPLTVVKFTYPHAMTHVKGAITVVNGPALSTLTLAAL